LSPNLCQHAQHQNYIRGLLLTFLTAWLKNFVATYGSACSTAAYDSSSGVYFHTFRLAALATDEVIPLTLHHMTRHLLTDIDRYQYVD